MTDWLRHTIGNDLIALYEGLPFTEDALLWLLEKPRTFGELRATEIDWFRWMAAKIHDKEILEKLSEDPDADVRMWVALNPVTPEGVLGKLGEDPVAFVRRSVAQNRNTPTPVLSTLNHGTDLLVRGLAFWNLNRRSRRREALSRPADQATSPYSGWWRN
jgi:hypothetical protein